MAFALNYILIASVELCISFFNDAWPYLFRVLALGEDEVVIIIYRQLIVDYDVDLL